MSSICDVPDRLGTYKTVEELAAELNVMVKGDSLAMILDEIYEFMVLYLEQTGLAVPYSLIATKYGKRCRKFGASLSNVIKLDHRVYLAFDAGGKSQRLMPREFTSDIERASDRHIKVAEMARTVLNPIKK